MKSIATREPPPLWRIGSAIARPPRTPFRGRLVAPVGPARAQRPVRVWRHATCRAVFPGPVFCRVAATCDRPDEPGLYALVFVRVLLLDGGSDERPVTEGGRFLS